MRNQQVESQIMGIIEEKTRLYEKAVMEYLESHAGTDFENSKKLYELLRQKLYRVLPEEHIGSLERLVELCECKKRIGIRYAWEKGRKLCFLVSEGTAIGFPRTDDETVYEYLQLYKLEQLPAYRSLEEKISELLKQAGEVCRLEKEYGDIENYYTNLEFDVLRVAHYLGYLMGLKEYEDIDSGLTEDRELTFTYELRMEKSFQTKEIVSEDSKENAEKSVLENTK